MTHFQKILFDKSIYGMNLLPARSHFLCFKNEKDLETKKTEETNLSGIWKGHFFEDFPLDFSKFLQEDFDISSEKDIEVPLSCELQGFEKPQYVNTEYPFDGYNKSENGGAITVKNPCVIYWKDVDVDDLTGRFILDVKGFESGLFLYVNGKEVGYSENLYLDSEFDISSYLKLGRNRLTMICFKYSTSSWLLDQDFFRFMGIFRDVSLFHLPQKHIFDIEILTDVDLKNSKGSVTINLTGEIEDCEKDISIFDAQNRMVYQQTISEDKLSFYLDNVSLWSAETPNLYTVVIQLKEKGKVQEIIKEFFGFKKVEIKDGILLMNGERLIVKGIDRHEWNPLRGRNVTLEDIDFDRDFLKKHNVNAIRTSHYPNRNEFYEMADKYGFYVLDEACLESHGTILAYNGWVNDDTPLPASKKEWEIICVEKVKRMYLRDKNHPSIFMYSLGNEAGRGTVFQAMREKLHELNPNILIHYEGCSIDPRWAFLSDVTSTMYMKPSEIKDVLERYPNKPYIQCEYAHAMGNSCGNLDEYHQAIYQYPSYQGGFIWDYIDQGLYTDGKKVTPHLHFGGDYLDKPNDHDFCCNGVIFADRKEAYKSSKALAMKHLYQPFFIQKEGEDIKVTNELLFLSLSCRIEIHYMVDGKRWMSEIHPKDCVKPHEVITYSIYDGFVKKNHDNALVIKIYTEEDVLGYKKGDLIAYQDFTLEMKEIPVETSTYPLEVINGNYNIGVQCGDLSLLFAKGNISFGMSGLISIKVKGEEYLALTALPTIFRATTNNDNANDFLWKSKLALSYSRYLMVDINETTWKISDNEFEITYHYLMDVKNKKGIYVTYHVSDKQEILVTVLYEPLEGIDTLGEIAMHFPIAKNICKATYFGRKMESYPDRKDGNELGTFSMNIEDGYTDYIYPQESGNREDTRYLELMNDKTSLVFSFVEHYFSFHFQKNSSFEIEEAKHVEELPDSFSNHLEIIGFMRGVGGDNSWGAPVHSQYEIDGKVEHRYQFKINVKK